MADMLAGEEEEEEQEQEEQESSLRGGTGWPFLCVHANKMYRYYIITSISTILHVKQMGYISIYIRLPWRQKT